MRYYLVEIEVYSTVASVRKQPKLLHKEYSVVGRVIVDCSRGVARWREQLSDQTKYNYPNSEVYVRITPLVAKDSVGSLLSTGVLVEHPEGAMIPPVHRH